MNRQTRMKFIASVFAIILIIDLRVLYQMKSTTEVSASSSTSLTQTRGQFPLPVKTGQVFVLDDFANKVTKSDLGTNYFAGNGGGLAETNLTWATESAYSGIGSLRLSYNLANSTFAGCFFSVFGLTDTKVSLDGSGREPAGTTAFPGYSLDTTDLYRGFRPWANRSVEQLRFDIRLDSPGPVTIKIELKDEANRLVHALRTINNNVFQTITLNLPGDFNQGATGSFNFRQVSVLSFVIDRANNPNNGALLLDNIAFVDTDGQYPDLAAARNDPRYAEAWLDYVRATSLLYFRDFASTAEDAGGIIQDRATFADLMSVGGAGFQLTALCIAAARDYIRYDEATDRVLKILRALRNGPQGPQRVGTTGYQGFFYHFLGIDGKRKQNFDFTATPTNEALNTVELSVIDTALALCGVITARQYFSCDNPQENEIRQLADEIYSRVNWRFMLDRETNQFVLGWKPNETRDDLCRGCARFKLNDADGLGQYASKVVNGQEKAATLDFYTDEGLLVALLALASPNANHRVDPSVFFAMERRGSPFIKTYPGSLFTYQFASCWLDTKSLGADRDPRGIAAPINYFDNTRQAILATREYARQNPLQHDSLNENRWGLSACEGPFDEYFAEGAPPAAHATHGECGNGTMRALEVGTLTVYGVGSSIVHAPEETLAALWEGERLGLFHPRFGAADAFNLNIADAAICVTPGDANVLRTTGEWRNCTGFGIDHGPMAILIDNYLAGQFTPKLFASYGPIRAALNTLFPDAKPTRSVPTRCPARRTVGGRTAR